MNDNSFVLKGTLKISRKVPVGKIILFLMLGLAGFVFQDPIKRRTYLFVGTRAAFAAVDNSCGNDERCNKSMKKVAEDCALKAADKAIDVGSEVLQVSLTGCLQKAFLKRSCRDDGRCLATINTSFDNCFTKAYPPGTDCNDSSRSGMLVQCLKDESAFH